MKLDMATGEYWATELAELLPRGTHLADADPDFRGMPFAQYAAMQGDWMEDEKHARAARRPDSVNLGRVWTPRDSYGWRSL